MTHLFVLLIYTLPLTQDVPQMDQTHQNRPKKRSISPGIFSETPCGPPTLSSFGFSLDSAILEIGSTSPQSTFSCGCQTSQGNRTPTQKHSELHNLASTQWVLLFYLRETRRCPTAMPGFLMERRWDLV